MGNQRWVNWSKTVSSSPESIIYPNTQDELIESIRIAISNNTKVKIVGSGHSCSKIAETHTGILIALNNLKNIINYDKELLQLEVQSGATLKSINNYLSTQDASLSNLGTIDSQTISGAISTGTHGTGINFGSVDQQIIELKIINGLGEILILNESSNSELFNLCKVGLGAFGVVLSVKIQCVPAFSLKVAQRSINFSEFDYYFNRLNESDHLRFWWAPHTDKMQLWKAKRINGFKTFGKSRLSWFKEVVIGDWTFQLLMWTSSFIKLFGKWTNKFIFNQVMGQSFDYTKDSKNAFVVPITIKQTVMEYAIPLEHTSEVLEKLHLLTSSSKYYVHMPIELRFAPKNNAFLSMSYGRPSCYIGIISYKPFGKSIKYDNFFKQVHDVLSAYEARPHWAKKHYYKSEEIKKLYPHWEKAKKMRIELDPKGVFKNEFLEKLFD